MNTVDVRDMASTQTLFWAVALPVTAAVGGMSLLAAYGGPSLQQHVRNLRNIRIEVQLFRFRKRRTVDVEQAHRGQTGESVRLRKATGRNKRGVIKFVKKEIFLGRMPDEHPRTRFATSNGSSVA